MAQFNRRYTNRLLGLWAPHLPPWAVVVHRGRRTGAIHRTPVAAFIAGSTVAISLAYGADTDWVKNLLAGGGGELIRRGRTVALTNPRVIERSHREELPRSLQRVGSASPHTLLADLGP